MKNLKIIFAPVTEAVTKKVHGPRTLTCATPPPNPPIKPEEISDNPAFLQKLIIASFENKRMPPGK